MIFGIKDSSRKCNCRGATFAPMSCISLPLEESIYLFSLYCFSLKAELSRQKKPTKIFFQESKTRQVETIQPIVLFSCSRHAVTMPSTPKTRSVGHISGRKDPWDKSSFCHSNHDIHTILQRLVFICYKNMLPVPCRVDCICGWWYWGKCLSAVSSVLAPRTRTKSQILMTG